MGGKWCFFYFFYLCFGNVSNIQILFFLGMVFSALKWAKWWL